MFKLDILAIGVHPDDVELCCSGTLLKHMALGYKVGILDLTKGELGTRGSAQLRKEESDKASKILGVEIRENLSLADGLFVYNEQSIKKIMQVIRKYQPEIVLANAISDRHPDHGRAAKLTADACFYSGLPKLETFDKTHLQVAWRPKAVYHYIQDHYIEPDFLVDISDYIDTKMQSILAYSSQFYIADSGEAETPISSKSFIDTLKGRMQVYGRSINVDYAEGFTTTKGLGIDNLLNLK